jgi:hypothetical protein
MNSQLTRHSLGTGNRNEKDAGLTLEGIFSTRTKKALFNKGFKNKTL